jgi:hypothetical protein
MFAEQLEDVGILLMGQRFAEGLDVLKEIINCSYNRLATLIVPQVLNSKPVSDALSWNSFRLCSSSASAGVSPQRISASVVHFPAIQLGSDLQTAT